MTQSCCLLFALSILAACTAGGPATTGGTPAGGGADGDRTNGTNGDGTNGGATTPPVNPGGGGTGGRCKATGTVCAAFTSENGWAFRTATSYSDGQDPKVSSMSGKAVFRADGTFVEDYTIGSLGFTNHYEGTYVLDGRFFTGKTTEGETLEYILACDDVSKDLAITFPKEDCSPSIIVGAKLIER